MTLRSIVRRGAPILAAAILTACSTGASRADLVAWYKLDGNTDDSQGAFDGTFNGGTPSYVPSPVSGQAIDLDGSTQYVDTVASGGVASALGIGGADPRTISAWARPEAFNNGGIWDLGPNASGEEYSLRTLGSTNRFRAQFWGGDVDFTAPGALEHWGHYAMTYDGTTARIYYNGVQYAELSRVLNTTDARPLEIGRYHGDSHFDGQIDSVRVYDQVLSPADVAAQFRGDGGYLEDFEGYGPRIDTSQWYTSGGMNSTRLRSNRAADGAYLLSTFDNDGGDPTGHLRNVYSVHQDHVTSLTWGQPLHVLDESGALTFRIAGGSLPIHEGSQTAGGAGLALWDLHANDFVRETGGDIRFVTHSANGGLEARSIGLDGLAGRIVMPVLYDRQTGGWGWVEIDSLAAAAGTVAPIEGLQHNVVLEYGFDEPGDFMGWTQEGVAGAPTDFQVGRMGNSLVARHVNLDGSFDLGEGFLSSTIQGDSENPTGILRSPDFVVAGDILEFYLSGGSTADLGLELVRSSDDTVLRSSRHGLNDNAFDYDFWTIGDLEGTEAYLRLRDERAVGGWGHIEVDAIRMVAFAVPEPSTFVLAGLGLGALALLV